MASVEELTTRSNSIIDSYERYGIKIEKKSDALYDNTIESAVTNMTLYEPAVAYSLTAAQATAELNSIISNNNLFYEDSIKRISRFLAYGYKIYLTPDDIAILAAQDSVINTRLVDNNRKFLTAIQSKMLSGITQGISTARLAKELATAYPEYAGYSRTILTTGLSWNFIDTNTKKFKEVGYKWYIWSGPNDALTRENPCKKIVNHKFPADDLASLTSIRLSLYNCRHTIIALSAKQAENYPVGNQSYITTKAKK